MMNKKIKISILCVLSLCALSFGTYAGDLVEIKNGVKTTHAEVTRPVIDTVNSNYDLKWMLDKNGNWKLNIIKINGRLLGISNSWVKVQRTVERDGVMIPVIDYYYFDINSNMVTGWYIDTNGDTYFLNTNSNELGRMARGWCQIGTSYYYFDPFGKLVRNAITPDGFLVDSDGKCG